MKRPLFCATLLVLLLSVTALVGIHYLRAKAATAAAEAEELERHTLYYQASLPGQRDRFFPMDIRGSNRELESALENGLRESMSVLTEEDSVTFRLVCAPHVWFTEATPSARYSLLSPKIKTTAILTVGDFRIRKETNGRDIAYYLEQSILDLETQKEKWVGQQAHKGTNDADGALRHMEDNFRAMAAVTLRKRTQESQSTILKFTDRR
jgi:hypothetical protein